MLQRIVFWLHLIVIGLLLSNRHRASLVDDSVFRNGQVSNLWQILM